MDLFWRLFPVDEIKKSYFSGLFDGEGYLTILKAFTTKDRYPKYFLTVGICMTSIGPLKQLQEYYGGSIYSREKARQNANYPIHEWKLSVRQCKKFLDDIYLYSQIKKEQIEIVYEFLQNVIYDKRHKLTKEDILLREYYREKLKTSKDNRG